jgi:hypothetical protein
MLTKNAAKILHFEIIGAIILYKIFLRSFMKICIKASKYFCKI